MKKKSRLDQALIDQGFFSNLKDAQTAVMLGHVFVEGKKTEKAGTPIDPNHTIEIQNPNSKFVSRGGEKLEGALRHWKVDVMNQTCLDVGSSTGGFVDALLQAGATQVFAIDVGTHQLHEKLRKDARVHLKENFHVKDLSPQTFGKTFDVVTIDVSFISLLQVLPFVLPVVAPKGCVLALMKPQFEAEPKDLIKGIVKDETTRLKLLDQFKTKLTSMGIAPFEVLDSPIKGSKGNQETFVFFRP